MQPAPWYQRWVYGVFIRGYGWALRVAALWHPKARHWVQGRRNWQERLAAAGDLTGCIWLHAASLGEFEQGRPLLVGLRKAYPSLKIVVSFFSPSGYERRKHWPGSDYTAYLPLDTPKQARVWVRALRPRLVVFVKYDLWYNYVWALQQEKVPAVLLAAHIAPDSRYLRGIQRSFYVNLLQGFTGIFTQTAAGAEALNEVLRANSASFIGDPRFDRVLEAQTVTPAISGQLALIRTWVNNRPCLVAGSTWPSDEHLLAAGTKTFLEDGGCLVIAPHNTGPAQIQSVERSFTEVVRLSTQPATGKVLVVDAFGLLKHLYGLGSIAYVGGGFRNALHNTLEAAAAGRRVLYGPKTGNFPEAQLWSAAGAGNVVSTAEELALELAQPVVAWQESGARARAAVEAHAGATQRALRRFLETEWFNDLPHVQQVAYRAEPAWGEVRRIREAVFIHEQAVDPAEEWDEFEATSTHYILTVAKRGVGTVRWRPYAPGVVKLERCAVLAEARSKGFGALLVKRVLQDAPPRHAVTLHAQEHAVPFYARLGFVAEGERFFEAGIPHFKMTRPSENTA